MTRIKFTLSTCLLFALLGPLVAVTLTGLWLSAIKGWSYWQGGGMLVLLGFGYLSGMLQALLYGLLCCVGLLAAVRLWPGFSGDRRPWHRLLLAQAVGMVVVLLLQGPSLYLRGSKLVPSGEHFWANLSRMWRLEVMEGTMLIGIAPFLAWYLVPTLVCVSVVGWRFVPLLRR